jgi:hypothetical protein
MKTTSHRGLGSRGGRPAVHRAFLSRLQLPEGEGHIFVEIGGPFTLASARGGVVDSASLKGKPHAIFFGFTHCPEVCPTALYEMSTLLEKLGEEAKPISACSSSPWTPSATRRR